MTTTYARTTVATTTTTASLRQFGKLSCINCRMGLVGNASDLTQCYKCPGGAFTNSSGATACTLCGDGTFLGKPSPLTPVGATACLKVW